MKNRLRVSVLLLAFCFAGSFLASCASEVVRVNGNFDAQPDTLYEAFIYVSYTDEKGFAGSGTFSDGVYVNYPNADKKFKEFDTVRIEFYGRDYKAEDSAYTANEGTEHSCVIFCKQTITKVKSARLSTGKGGEFVYAKPIIYLYPEEDTLCSVTLDLNGKLTCTYPAYGENGWTNFTAKPDGTLIFPDGSEYYALYWEGLSDLAYDFSSGFCVKGEDTAAFLAEILPKLGLSAREANEFIVYWLPRMQENAYNLISFQTDVYTDNAQLNVSPAPDTCIRVFMAYKSLTAPVDLPAQTFETPERTGFTVVEWGGSEVTV